MNSRRITLIKPSQIDDFFNDEGLSTLVPKDVEIDLFETPDNLVLKIKAAGYKEDQVKISVESNILNIEGTMNEDNSQSSNKKYYIKEIKFEHFSRSIPLPIKIDPEKSEATFEDGILTINLAKMEEIKPKVITIKPSSKKQLTSHELI